MHVLVTGANGFIGSHVVRALAARGDRVRALVRRTSRRDLLAGCTPEYVVGDTTAPETLPPALVGVDVVVHLAGALGATDQARFDAVNVHGTRALVDAVLAHRPDLRRFVLVSSIAAGGPARDGAARSEDEPPAPVSRYGRSKLGGERAVEVLLGRVPATIVRPPIVYGPGGESMLTLFRTVARGLLVEPAGPARPASFIDVRDLVTGILTAATHAGAVDRTFHLVGPESGTLLAFQREIAQQLGVRARALRVPGWALQVAGVATDLWKRASGSRHPFGRDKVAEALAPSWVASGDKAARLLGFAPRIGWAEGVRDSLADYRVRGWLAA